MTNPWRPIESAPKDGTVVDLWCVSDNSRDQRIADAKWVKPDGRRGKAGPQWCVFDHEFGFTEVESLGETYFFKATHWMPLPEGPSNEDT